MKVLHAPSSTGGNPQALSRALRELGVDSLSLVVSQNYLGYPADVVLHRPGQSLLLREIKRLWAIFVLLPRFDVVHYNAGTTLASAYAISFQMNRGLSGVFREIYSAYLRLLQRVELTYVRWLGMPLFMTYQGDDARQGDYCLGHFAISIAAQVDEGYYCQRSDAFKRNSIARIGELACEIYSVNPDLMHVLPKRARFIPYGHVFLNEWVPKYSQEHAGPLRILHAPSHRKVKGTDLILSALDRLRIQGYEFELLLVEGLSNSEAHKIYESADVSVDQLFAGWYGGLAVELMSLGKPVLAYIRDEDLQFIPEQMREELPLIQVTPDSIQSVLQGVLEMPRSQLVALGQRSRAFVERWHDPVRIAVAVKEAYESAIVMRKKGIY